MTSLEPPILDALRQSLESHREDLRKEIADQGVDPDSEEFVVDLETGFADSAHTTAERARLVSVVEQLRTNLGEVEHALAKMDRGSYGTCERCHQPIAIERLETLPWARLCISCKQKS